MRSEKIKNGPQKLAAEIKKKTNRKLTKAGKKTVDNVDSRREKKQKLERIL